MRPFWLGLSLLLAGPAAAQSLAVDESAWRLTDSEAPRPLRTDIAVPREAGPLQLTRLSAFRPGGLDNGATYRSRDGGLIATVYIYRPMLADAGYTMIAADAALRGNLTAVVAAPETLVAAGGVADAAHRRLYSGLLSRNGQSRSLASGLAALRAGHWIVKLRVTGPGERQADVAAALDSLLAGLTFGPSSTVSRSRLDEVSSCPDASSPAPPKRGKAEPAFAALLLGLQPPASGSGPRRLCEMARRHTPQSLDIVLRPTDGPASVPSVVLMGDAGDSAQVLPPFLGMRGYVVVTDSLDAATLFGPFEWAPAARLLLDLPAKSSDWIGPAVARLTRGPDGKAAVSVEIKPAK